jgi:formylglycine-generating enzyme required for sulfatase activity
VPVNPQTFVRQYEVEQDVSIRRALLLALGEFDPAKLPADRRKDLEKLIPRLRQDYRTDADPGIHSAVGWFLRRWEQGAAQQIDQELAGQSLNQRRWYVTKQQGHTLAVFPRSKPDKRAQEPLRQRPLPHSFALATEEVTVRQFGNFLQAHPDIAAGFQKRFEKDHSPNLDDPVVGVTWLEAAQYCWWLSEQEGVPESEQCYPSVAEIEKSKDGQTPLLLHAHCLTKTGYRLPTQAEWEYACRAGAVTSRPFGNADALLDDYAWYVHNSTGRARPVGNKRPNDAGMFDMLGNAWEWCQDAVDPPGPEKERSNDREDKESIRHAVRRVLRGGAYLSLASDVHSASWFGFQPHVPFILAGLRVARTLP